MKTIAVISILLAVSAVYFMNSSTSPNAEFEEYIGKYAKNYVTLEEYNFRKSIFDSNMEYVRRENAKGHSYILGATQFADWTLEEFKSILGYKPMRPFRELNGEEETILGDYESIDWNQAGDVSAVPNQGSCGSCWAFSAVAALESAHAVHGDGLFKFSEQQLVDCDPQSNGCNGGEMYYAFQYYEQHGACLEKNYKYTARDGTCKDSTCDTDSSSISSYVLIQDNDPSEIHDNLQYGPHSIGVAAGSIVWQLYFGGVVHESEEFICGHNLDHGVLLTGYNSENQSWAIRNSWGTGWGDHGYIHIYDNNKKNSYGVCGVNMEISRPVL